MKAVKTISVKEIQATVYLYYQQKKVQKDLFLLILWFIGDNDACIIFQNLKSNNVW